MTEPLSFRISGYTLDMDQNKIMAWLNDEAGPVAKVLLDIGYQVEYKAKVYCPVDTGRLRASINTALELGSDGLSCVVGTNVEYAIFVEFGTIHMAAQSFLRRALEEVRGGI